MYICFIISIKMEEKSLVRISNVLNLTRQEFNTLEKHIFLFTLLKLKSLQGINLKLDDDMVNVEIKFPASDLKETNRGRIKEALDKITTRKIYFQNKTELKEEFGFVVPFNYASYSSKNGAGSEITIMLNSKCKGLFLELAKGYTTTDLKAVLNLKSINSIRMYELLSMYQGLGDWHVKVDELKTLLGLEYGKYKNFSDFEKYVLIYSQKELWEHCDLHFDWAISKKDKKKITELVFSIQSKAKQEKIELNENIKHTIDYVSGLSPMEIRDKFQMVSTKYQLSEQQVNHIITNTDFFNEFIRIDIIIENMIEKGKPPKDRTKYLASSLGFNKIKFAKAKK